MGIYVGDRLMKWSILQEYQPRSRASLNNLFASSSSCLEFLDSCGFQNGNSGVIHSCLDCFLEGGPMYQFEYGVSKVIFLTQAHGGTCTLAQSHPPKTLLHHAKYLLQNGFVNYNTISRNYENLTTYCKTRFIFKSSYVEWESTSNEWWSIFFYFILHLDTLMFVVGLVGITFVVVEAYSLKET